MNTRPAPLTIEQKIQVEVVASALDRLACDHEAEIMRARADAGTLLASLSSAADGWLYLTADAALTAAIATTGGKVSLEYMIARRNLQWLGEAADEAALAVEALPPPPSAEERRASFRVLTGGKLPQRIPAPMPTGIRRVEAARVLPADEVDAIYSEPAAKDAS